MCEDLRGLHRAQHEAAAALLVQDADRVASLADPGRTAHAIRGDHPLRRLERGRVAAAAHIWTVE